MTLHLLELSIFDVQRSTATLYWIEFHQKPIAAVRSSQAYLVRWHVTSLRNLLQGYRYKGGHWTIFFNTGQYHTMLDNIRKFLTLLDNITFSRILLQLGKERAEIAT